MTEKILSDNKGGGFEGLLPRIRSRFLLIEHDAAGNRRTYLNSAAGSLMVDDAAVAACEAGRGLNPMPGAVTPAETATARFHEAVRESAAAFLNARSPREITFHASTTAALFNLAFALRGEAGHGDNVIVTDLDHMANISPWEALLGAGAGAEIRRARVTDEGTLDIDHLLSLADPRTRILALTMASNAFGSIVPLGELIPAVRARAPRCLVVVDAVHHALHGPIDVQAIGCDFLAFSGYKVFGPMLGVLWGRESELERAQPYRVETNKDEPPFKFEMGMLSNAALASLKAALDYLLWLGRETAGPMSASEGIGTRFSAAMWAIAAYEGGLSRRVLEGLGRLPSRKFTLYGLSDADRVEERDPTFAFEISGLGPSQIKEILWKDHAIQIADGNHYSAAVTRHLGKPALCRASFAHYDTLETADRFVAALREVVRKRA